MTVIVLLFLARYENYATHWAYCYFTLLYRMYSRPIVTSPWLW